jgi:hypothetical protein
MVFRLFLTKRVPFINTQINQNPSRRQRRDSQPISCGGLPRLSLRQPVVSGPSYRDGVERSNLRNLVFCSLHGVPPARLPGKRFHIKRSTFYRSNVQRKKPESRRRSGQTAAVSASEYALPTFCSAAEKPSVHLQPVAGPVRDTGFRIVRSRCTFGNRLKPGNSPS